jgi:hypothetical protein
MGSVEVYSAIQNYTPYFVIAAIMEALAVYLFQFRKIPGSIQLVYCQLCKAGWLMGRVLIGAADDLPTKLFWTKLPDTMSILLIYFWFIFANSH